MKLLRSLLLAALPAVAGSAAAVLFSTPTVNDQFRYVTTDNSGNVYVVGYALPDMLVASFNSAGTLRWNRTFDGGFSQADYPLAINVHNANVNVAYEIPNSGGFRSYGTQVFQRVTGTPGAQSTFSPVEDTWGGVATCVQDVATFVGTKLVGSNSSAFMLQFDGVNPPATYNYAPSTYVRFVDIVTIPSGTYLTGLDGGGDFVCKWDFATGAPAWRTTLPIHASPTHIAADSNGDIFVAGRNTNAAGNYDMTVCKYSSAGVFLGQGIADSGGGYDDMALGFCLMGGNKPVVVGYRNILNGTRSLFGAVFRTNLTVNYTFIDPGVAVQANSITSDASDAYVAAEGVNSTDSHIYKIGAGGVFWHTQLNQTAGSERIYQILYRSGMLLVAGGTLGVSDGFVNRIDPVLGGVTW